MKLRGCNRVVKMADWLRVEQDVGDWMLSLMNLKSGRG